MSRGESEVPNDFIPITESPVNSDILKNDSKPVALLTWQVPGGANVRLPMVSAV